jgi:hypothetical protein
MNRWALCGASVVAALSIIAACAHGEDDVDLGGVGVIDPDGGGDEVRAPARDGGGGAVDGSKPDSSSDANPGCTGKVVINEIMTRGGSAMEEFVELYNTGSCRVSVGKWKLAYKPKAGGSSSSVIHEFKASDGVEGQSFLVIGTASFGAKDITMNGGMADEGQVGLLDDNDALIDALGYGGATGDFVEGSAAPSPPANGSVGRKTDGEDTDKNSVDCKSFGKHTAGESNQ